MNSEVIKEMGQFLIDAAKKDEDAEKKYQEIREYHQKKDALDASLHQKKLDLENLQKEFDLARSEFSVWERVTKESKEIAKQRNSQEVTEHKEKLAAEIEDATREATAARKIIEEEMTKLKMERDAVRADTESAKKELAELKARLGF